MSKPTVKISQARGALRCAAVSDVGMRRTSNQDSMTVALAETDDQWKLRGHLFVVADGMGAHAAGELASQLAIDNIPLSYLKRQNMPPCEAIAAAVQDANGRIYAKGQNSVDFHGMGTTCSCLLLLADGAMAAHVGDSRVYRLRDQSIEQLTFDHSLVWEMAAAGQATEEEIPAYVPKNVITRSLGPHPTVKVDLEGPLPIEAGDRYLVCSDGLTGPLDPHLIGMILASLSPEDAAQTLVDLANLLGGPDNITAVVAEVGDPAQLGSGIPYTWTDEMAARLGSDKGSLSMIAGVASIVAGIAAIAAGALRMVGGPATGMVLSAIGALFGVAGWMLVSKSSRPASGRVTGTFGKAPYRRYQVAPSAENIQMLSEIVRQLEDLEGQRDWPIDWAAVHRDRHRAHEAISAGDFRGAVVAYARAVRTLMQAVRAARREPSDSSINLGRD